MRIITVLKIQNLAFSYIKENYRTQYSEKAFLIIYIFKHLNKQMENIKVSSLEYEI